MKYCYIEDIFIPIICKPVIDYVHFASSIYSVKNSKTCKFGFFNRCKHLNKFHLKISGLSDTDWISYLRGAMLFALKKQSLNNPTPIQNCDTVRTVYVKFQQKKGHNSGVLLS